MFDGLSYRLTFNGSFNGNENLEELPAGDFSVEARNIDIHNGTAEPRGGTQVVGTQIVAALSSLGGGQLIKRSGTVHTYWAGNNGKVYRDGAEILTGRSTTARTRFVPADDKMFILNGVDLVKVDTGASVATITTPAADWTGSTQPSWACLHAKGSSRRLFFGGVPGFENTLYYTVSGSFENLTGTGAGTKVVDVPDGWGVINAVSKDGFLWLQGRSKTYVLQDEDISHTNWGHYSASFKGGVHSPELVCQAENRIFAMNTEGNIYEVQTAESVQAVTEASISNPFFIHNYIRNNIDLTKIDSFHMAYDPKIRGLRIFMVRTGRTECDVCLTWLIDQKRWVPPHDGIENEDGSGFHASASFEATLTTGQKKLYTQDYNGKTWELSSSTKTDGSNAYTKKTSSGWLYFDMPSTEKRFVYAALSYRTRGDYTVTVNMSVDGLDQPPVVLPLSGEGALLGSFTLDSDVLSASTSAAATRQFDVGAVGERIRVSIDNAAAGNDYSLSHAMFYFHSLGAQRRG